MLFAAIAIGVVVVDQLVKAWIVGNLAIGDSFQLIGDLVRIIHWRNSGILFGMLPQSAGAFAIVSLVRGRGHRLLPRRRPAAAWW